MIKQTTNVVLQICYVVMTVENLFMISLHALTLRYWFDSSVPSASWQSLMYLYCGLTGLYRVAYAAHILAGICQVFFYKSFYMKVVGTYYSASTLTQLVIYPEDKLNTDKYRNIRKKIMIREFTPSRTTEMAPVKRSISKNNWQQNANSFRYNLQRIADTTTNVVRKFSYWNKLAY